MSLRLLHWGPILALSVISIIAIMSIACLMQWWPPFGSPGGVINSMIYCVWIVTVLYNFFNAVFIGPGHVPSEWKPKEESDTDFLQYCETCESYKAPRSHHCRKCNRCVLKMDHHCPWINNCVGHFNHGSFTSFLFFAPCGCIHSISILIPSMYRALNRHYYIYYGTGEEPLVHLDINTFIASMFATGLAIGVIVAVGGLFFIQMRSIIRNETGIESWIREKAKYRDLEEDEEEFVYPYNLGRWENLGLVFHWSPRKDLNGIWWPVIEGCNQYTLTVEQIKQKREKKERSVAYEIKYAYSGAIFPITKGPRVCCCPPCTDEPRIPLQPGDKVLVSRWKKHWLYGDKIFEEKTSKEGMKKIRLRGWFPRKCAIEVLRMENGEAGNEDKDLDAKKDD